MLNQLKKITLYLFAFLVLLVGLAALAIRWYQAEIVGMVISEINKSLTAKVEVGKIELSLFEKFPQLTLSFKNVTVHGSLPQHQEPLAKAQRLYLTFNLWGLLGSSYVVNRVYLENADVRIYLDEQGNENYNIVRTGSSKPGKPSQEINFDLNRIFLTNVHVQYTDLSIDQQYKLQARQVTARLMVKGPDILINLDGQVQSHSIRIGDEKYFANKPLSIQSELQYDQRLRKLLIQPSTVRVKKSEFLVMGSFVSRPRSFIDLQVEGKQADVQTLLSLLPTQISDPYESYQSKGGVYFKGSVLGYVSRGAIPLVDVKFGCRNASFYETTLHKRLENAYLTGTFSNGKEQNRRTSSLHLRNIRGRLDGKPFSGNFSLSNFANPYLNFDLNGQMDVASALAFYPGAPVQNGAGLLSANIKFEGNLADLQSKALNRFVRTSGKIGLRNVAFTLTSRPLQFRQLNGEFTFSKSDLVISKFTGKVGSSDFALNGWFKNILSYLLLDDQRLRVEAELQSHHLNFDELLAENPTVTTSASATASRAYQFSISPQLELDLVCQVNHVKFRRFQARQVRGDLTLQEQIARSNNIRLEAANGQMELNASVNARKTNFMEVSCNALFTNIAIDSVFYLFENFDQSFIQDRHLRGNVRARVQTYMVFNNQLEMNEPRLVADVYGRVTNGQLNNFDPMQKLSRFVNQDELANLRFSDLENTIHIENRTVFIPKMEINSNVANISIQGSHTFDQVMDYHLRLPIRTLFQRKVQTASHGEEETGESREKGNLFLTIKGTADRYKIGYDTRAVGEKIRDDLRKGIPRINEGQDTYKKSKPSPRQVRTLQAQEKEEEYFDFE